MKKSNQGISSGLKAVIIFIVIMVAIFGLVAAFSVGPAPVASNPVAVELEVTPGIIVPITTNYSLPQPLEWGPTTPGNTYTKNLTVTNNGAQNLTLKLFTTEPIGTMQSWAPNNTQLNPLSTVSSTLTLTLSTFVGTGSYTWRLLAVNGTVALPPEAQPPEEQEPEILNFTINPNTGMQNVSFTIGLGTPITIPATALPKIFIFTSGADIIFQTVPKTSSVMNYTFSYWESTFEPFTIGDQVYSLVNVTQSFTLKPYFDEATG